MRIKYVLGIIFFLTLSFNCSIQKEEEERAEIKHETDIDKAKNNIS